MNQILTKYKKIQLQKMQRKITTFPSMKHCGTTPIPDRVAVNLKIRGVSSGWDGLQRCKNKLCAACHGAERRKFISKADAALYAVEKQGGSIVMATFTCSNKGISAYDHMRLLDVARRKLFKRRPVVRLLESLGFLGFVRGVEPQVNTAQMRFHTHLHLALAFTGKVTEEEAIAVRDLLARTWCEIVQKSGGFAVMGQQHMTRAADGQEAAKYVSKGVALEIGSGYTKQGKTEGSVSFYGLLWMIAECDEQGDEERRDALILLYRELERASKGLQFISMSPSLRNLAGNDEIEEGEIDVTEETEEETDSVSVPLIVYRGLLSLKVAHLAPSFLAANKKQLEQFKTVCAGEEKISGEEILEAKRHGYMTGDEDLIKSELLLIFGELCNLDVWAQNRKLGVYGNPAGRQKARSRLHIKKAG